jgi:hypothetical protein
MNLAENIIKLVFEKGDFKAHSLRYFNEFSRMGKCKAEISKKQAWKT